MVYVGLDLHKRYITACALDAEGRVLAEDWRLTTDIAALLTWLGSLTGPVSVVLEATLFWAWLERQLTPAGYPVVVAHPYQGSSSGRPARRRIPSTRESLPSSRASTCCRRSGFPMRRRARSASYSVGACFWCASARW